jgi:hypothetical protein
MTFIPARELQGVGSIPASKPAALAWLKRAAVASKSCGQALLFDVDQLPERERLAYQARVAERSGLAGGVQDDAAHLALMAKPMGVQL